MTTIIIGIIITVVGGLLLALLKRRFLPRESVGRKESNGDYFFIVLERDRIISGSASILINNEPVGELQVKLGNEKDQLKVDLSYEGPVKYEIHGRRETLVSDEDSNEMVDRGIANGQGTISPKPGETLYLKFWTQLEGHGVGIRIATLEHAPTPEGMRRTLDLIVTELILNPGEDFQARDELFKHMLANSEAMNLSEDQALDLTLNTSDDAIIHYLIHKDLVSESVAAKYQARAPLGR